MPFSSPAKTHSPQNEIDINSQLQLMQLAVGLLQRNASQEALRFKDREIYRGGRGRDNKAGAWRKEVVSKSAIPKITTPIPSVDSSTQGAKTESSETAKTAESSLPSLKRLSKIEIEECIKYARENEIFVDGI
ncbi:MAG: hypothetical protein ACKO6C_06040, partial [Alphaproteobacteria bacterium]